MFKKRNINKPTRKREAEEEPAEPVHNGDEQTEEANLPIEDLIALRKLRKSRQGIELQKLNQGDVKKKRKKAEDEEEEPAYGLQKAKAAVRDEDDNVNADDEEAKARKLVRSNNFTGQTNKLDVDKHMMAYIEENMRALTGKSAEQQKVEEEVWDPQAELYKIDDKYRVKQKESEEGSVTNSLAMLTAIPEVDLGIDVRLKNIEETEKAKRLLEDEKKAAKRDVRAEEEAHLAATRFLQPNQRRTSDADALRNAKLEAMGIEVPEPRRKNDRKETATDDVVMERFKKRMKR